MILKKRHCGVCDCGCELFSKDIVFYNTYVTVPFFGKLKGYAIFRCPKCFKTHQSEKIK